MIRKLFIWVGAFFLLCSLVPAIGYGIVNTGSGALFVLGLFLLFWPKYSNLIKRVGLLRKFTVFVAVTGAIYAVTVLTLMIRQAYFIPPDETGEIAVIVLGSGIRGDQPSLMLRRRLDTACLYMEENPYAICVVTGGQGPDEDYPEALVMKNYLIGKGISQERIIMENKSVNTRENIRFAAKLLPKGNMPAVIVTDGFHQLRASIFARAEGFIDIYSLSSRTPWGLVPIFWTRDMLGVAWAWVTT